MAVSSLGRLTLDLIVKLGSYEQGLDAAERKTKKSADNMKQAFSGFKQQIADAFGGTQIGSVIDGFNSKIGSLKGGILVAGAAIAGMAVGGVIAGVGALAQMSIEAAKADAELQVLANRANTSVQNFQILEKASAGLGVTQDQLGAILADVQEKLGEFSATQGGGAADFFDALKNNTKMTDDQIKAFGKTLQGKDGVEAIQMLNDKMDELGVTSQERRFVFESLASDLGNLAPLFAENGQLLNEYGKALEDAGVLKTKESMEQSRLLAAQTEALQIRYDGFKNQLTSQMMPVLNSIISQFMDGSVKSGQFGSVIQSVGVIAKGVGLLIIGLAAAIKTVVIAVSAFAEQAANISITAQNVWNADGVIAKAKALGSGVRDGFGIAQKSVAELGENFTSTLDSMSAVMNANAAKATDPLVQVMLKTGAAAKNSAAGLKLDTKAAEENAKAAEKQAAAKAKLNKELQVNAKVQANAAKFGFASLESQYKLPSGLLSAVNMQESRGNANAVGPQTKYGTAKGGFQLIDDTAKRFGLIGNDVFNTGKAAEAAAKYFQILYGKFGTWEKAISAYHAGEGNVERGTGLGPINREYVKNIMGYMNATLKGVGTTANDAVQYVEEVLRAQQSVVQQYLTEREKIELDHGQKLKDIQKAFAGDQSAIQKYTDLQNAAYQKDLTEYTQAQKLKDLSEKKALLEVRKNWLSAEQYAQQYYALVREEILATAEYSPDMQHALIKQANAEQGMEQNAEREQVWGDYQSRFGVDNYMQDDIQLLQDALNQKLITEEEYFTQRAKLHTQWGQSYISGAADVMKQVLGENSKAYQAMFLMQRALALSEVLLNAPKTYSAVFASASTIPMVGPFIAPGLAAGAVALQMAQAAAIGSVSFNPVGMAHEGIDNIPKEGTWLLDKGERVVDARTNGDLKDFIANNNNGPKVIINVPPGHTAKQNVGADGTVNIDIMQQYVDSRFDSVRKSNSRESRIFQETFGLSPSR